MAKIIKTSANLLANPYSKNIRTRVLESPKGNEKGRELIMRKCKVSKKIYQVHVNSKAELSADELFFLKYNVTPDEKLKMSDNYIKSLIKNKTKNE